MTSLIVFNWRDIKNPNAGGAELYTHEIFSRLVKTYGYRVTMFTSEFEGAEADTTIDGIDVVRRGGRYSVYREAKKFYLEREKEFDVVFDEINTRPFLTPTFVRGRRPIIAIIHQLAREYWWHETKFPLNVIGYYFLENHWLKHYRSIPTVTVSNSSLTELDKLGFLNVQVIHNGVSVKPLDSMPKKSDVFTAAFVARLTSVKRPEDAIRAFLRVAGDNSRLTIVGDGKLRESLSMKYQGKKVEFLGRVSDTRKSEVLTGAHVHLAPYLKEGWGNTIIEAAAVGTPSIGYETSGLVDSILDQKTGFLVDRFDVELFSEKIKFAMENPETIRKMGSNCLEWAKKFSWDESAAKFHSLISSVTASPNTG